MPSLHSMLSGHGCLDVQLDADLILPQEPAPLADETAAIHQALERPIGTRPLAEIVRPGERVAIVVNDITRLAHTDLLLPPIVETLNRAGVPDSDIFVVFALGLHRRQTDAERKKIVGEEMFRRLRMFDHNAEDDSNLAAVGTTSAGNRVEINRQVWEADRIILTGEIIHHMIAGYSGGRKSLVPGVAGRRTITFNHRMILDPGCESGVLDGNPAHEDLLEACRMIEPDFILNVVLTTSGRLAAVVAGHYDLAHREGAKAADKQNRGQTDLSPNAVGNVLSSQGRMPCGAGPGLRRPPRPPSGPAGGRPAAHGAAPHGAAPHGAAPHGAAPHGAAPHGAAPHG